MATTHRCILRCLTQLRDVDAIYNICSLKLESMPVVAQDVKDTTRRDAVLSMMVTFVKSGWPEEMDDKRIRPFWKKRWEWTAEEDCLFWGLRVVIPPPLRDAVLHELHVAHHGMVKMKEVARSHMWWETIDRDIETLVRRCASCQQTRPVPTAAPLTPWM